MNFNLYKRTLHVFGRHFGGSFNYPEIDIAEKQCQQPVIQAFLADDDYQEMTLLSANLLMSVTLRKQYISQEKPLIGKKDVA